MDGREIRRSGALRQKGRKKGRERPTTAVPNLQVQLAEDDAGEARGVKAFLFTEQVLHY